MNDDSTLPPEDDDRTVIMSMDDIAAAQAAAGGAAAQTDVSEPGSQTHSETTDLEPNALVGSPAAAVPLAPQGIKTPAVAQAPIPEPQLAQLNLEPGTVINNMYLVEEALDQGGMGRVFKGEEIGTGEAVAIKVILPEMAENVRVGQMFKREARTLRQLHHPAIVRYFAYVAPDAERNIHALVMGFIEGIKLSDYLKDQGPLNESDACRLFVRLADGLKKAHDIGVVHRDLSPDNVMLQDGDIVRGVLIDFGISRSSQVKDVTIGNEFAGKLKYVSPEQLGAFGGEADGRSDIYSLGLLLIAALTGKTLQMGDSIVDAVQKRQTIPDLSMLPANFQSLIYQMLQPDPAQRLGDMQQVIDALQAIAGGSQLGGLTQQPTQTGFGSVKSTHSVPGLQSSPIAQSSFGMQTPNTMNMGASVQSDEPDEPKRGGLGLVLGLLVLGGALAGGGYYWWSTQSAGVPAAQVAEIDGLARDPNSQEGFLVGQAASECTLATRQSVGDDVGRIRAYSASGDVFSGLAALWQTQFGSTADVVETKIDAVQCAALEFAKPFLGTTRPHIEITFDADTVARESGVVGTIHGSSERQVWLGIVAPNGRVFSLTRQLEAPIGERRRFSFRLPSAQPGVYSIVATASDKASVRAGAMTEGVEASVILPLIGREMELADAGFATMATVTIQP
jgi:serine/threonine-protein kinase